MADIAQWRPGSFTKNFGWGKPSDGLKQLYDVIKLGFDGELKDTQRAVFRQRVQHLSDIAKIPINFFLYHKIESGVE